VQITITVTIICKVFRLLPNQNVQIRI